MQKHERIKLFKDVFAPKSGEKILFLIDKPHDNIVDNQSWKERREMANDWFESFKDMSLDIGFTIDFAEFDATGIHNTPVPDDIMDLACNANLVITMTEFSGSSSFIDLCLNKSKITRCASMPGIEKHIEQTALKANYIDVKIYANNIKNLLTKAIGAKVLFSSGDELFIDLRNRVAFADEGDCSKTGQCINFPSGEGYIAPYEAADDEINEYGESKTEGILPDNQHRDLIKYRIKNNKITEIIGKGSNADEMREFFNKNPSRKNIAELGFGCNPEAVVTGNILEDEKVDGLHIAYGMSLHTGGKNESDTHVDICFPKGLPAFAKTLILINEDGSTIELVTDSNLRYDMLK